MAASILRRPTRSVHTTPRTGTSAAGIFRIGTFRARILRTLGFVTCLLSAAALAEAQQTGTAVSGGASGSGQGSTQAAAGNAGQQLTSQNLFSNAGDTTGTLGANQGRFAGSQLQNAPLATGTGQNTTAGTGQSSNQFRRRNTRGNTSRPRNQQNRFGQPGTSRPTIRPSLRLGFVPPVRPAADVSRSVERRFQVLSARVARLGDTLPAFRGVSIQVQDAGRVRLTGEVTSARAARLAENILRMEAGVRRVQNDLTVAAAPPARPAS